MRKIERITQYILKLITNIEKINKQAAGFKMRHLMEVTISTTIHKEKNLFFKVKFHVHVIYY